MSPSYGHAYLASYGWTGTGTALRKGAIAKPLAIPQKKNLSGLGKDRDEAFPFWDHLFAAASKAITIKVSSDDESEDADETEDVSPSDPASAPLRRTATGILSNRRPVSSTPASTSGSTTPSLVAPDTGTAGRPSLLATAKREAAKRGLYARFFRGPVLGPGDDPQSHGVTGASDLASASPEPSSPSTPIPEHDDGKKDIAEETKKSKKRESGEWAETDDERRERKRLKRERKLARAAKKAEKALANDKAEKKNQVDRKARKLPDAEMESEENTAKKARNKTQQSGSAGNDLEQPESTPNRLGDELQVDGSYRPPSNMDAADTIRPTKKRKDTPS